MKTITIMPDFGNGPFAWLKRTDDRGTGIGVCIADAVSGFRYTEFRVSPELEAGFREWAVRFERGARDNRDFPWWQFHETGIALACRLKSEIGTAARVVYAKPPEDPWHREERRMEVLTNGELIAAERRYVPRGKAP